MSVLEAPAWCSALAAPAETGTDEGAAQGLHSVRGSQQDAVGLTHPRAPGQEQSTKREGRLCVSRKGQEISAQTQKEIQNNLQIPYSNQEGD